MKYFLDFDRVLFDHDALKTAIQARQLEHLYAEPTLWDQLSPADFLYDDVSEFLAALPIAKTVVISAYTARIGPNAAVYQDRKLAESGIGDLVSEVVVMDGPKAPYIADRLSAGESGFFVDDKRRYVEEVAVACPSVTCVQLLRPGAERTKFDETTKPELEIPVVSDLAAAAAIMGV